MRKINEIHACFLLSLVTHLGVFGSGLLNIEKPPKTIEPEITFEIEQPEYLPDTYQITEEKKIEKVKQEEIPEEPIVEEVIEEVKEEIPKNDSLKEKLKKSLLRYQDSIKQKIQESKQYPRWALRAKHQGIVRIVFDVLHSGEVSDLSLVQSSGFEELDKEALEAVKRASPFANFPEVLKEDAIQIEVDIVFTISKKID
jgi:periplasmic protein TonB